MGVFPLADTMSFSSNPPFARGGTSHAPVNGWTDEVWRDSHPTTVRHNAAAPHSSIHYISDPLAFTRCPVADPVAEQGPPFATSRMPSPAPPACMRHSSPVAAPQVLVFAAGGTRLQ